MDEVITYALAWVLGATLWVAAEVALYSWMTVNGLL
jgi:hypothetical protein